jgi:two-component system chemotaxis response regulator CheB
MDTHRIASAEPIKVIIVDDSAVVRGLISKTLSDDPAIDVVATESNGAQAVNHMAKGKADVIILDIEMPEMDGLTALPALLKVDPEVRIIMASTLTEKNAEVSLKALEAGAADYIPKPSTAHSLGTGTDFQRELLQKVKTLGATARQKKPAAAAATARAEKKPPSAMPDFSGEVKLVKPPVVITRPAILAIGSSTGGPAALFEFLKALHGKIEMPIVISQHMPPKFTTILAQHISRMSGMDAKEAEDGDKVEPRHVYLAPGDYHMTVVDDGDGVRIRLNQDAPENFCRPAVDPMLRSVAKVYGKRALVVILTGMGYDGMKGSQVVLEAGGTILAQDEATSVVWGMPGAVAHAGLCTQVLPLPKLAPFITDFVSRATV